MKTKKQLKVMAIITLITLTLAFTGCIRIGSEYNSPFSALPVSYGYTPQQTTQIVKKPITIYGNFDAYGDNQYRIQVGAPTSHDKALVTSMWLQQFNLDPTRETAAQYTRVVLRCIPSYQVANILFVIENMGIDQVWVQPDVPAAPTQINNYYYDGNPARSSNSENKSYYYEPSVSVITGLLTTKTVDTEDLWGTGLQNIFVVNTNNPINVINVKGDGYDEETVYNISTIQLTGSDINFSEYIGKRVRLTGEFFYMHTGHHFTEVLMFVEKVEVL